MESAEFYRDYHKLSEKELIFYLKNNPKADRDDNPAIFRYKTGPQDKMFTYCEIQALNGILKVGSRHSRIKFNPDYGFWLRKDYLSYKEALAISIS